MAAKNKRPILDLHTAVGEHVAASKKAHEWAEKCLALRAAGKTAQAKTAENKARSWLKKAIALEDRAQHGKPTGVRTLGRRDD